MADHHKWLEHYPEKVDWNAELIAKPVYNLLIESAEKFPENICLEFKGREWTYREILTQSKKFAAYLQRLEVGKGTKVGLFLPNCPQFIIAYYGIMLAGATAVNFNPLYSKSEVEHQINDSKTELMVTLSLNMLYPKIAGFIGTTSLEKVIIGQLTDYLPFTKAALFKIAKAKDICSYPQNDNHIAWSEVMKSSTDIIPVEIDPKKDIAVLQYTGGTTGVPKGVVLTHANLTYNVQQCAMWLYEIEDGKEIMLGVLPFFHVFAMAVVMNLGIAKAMKIIIHPRFELKTLLDDVQSKKPTLMPGVPAIYNSILHYKKIKSYDLSSLNMCISGGAGLPVEVKNKFEKITGCKLVEGYGLSESSPVVSVNPLYGTIKAGSIGQPLPQTTLEIVDMDDGKTLLPQGGKGEICIKGPQVMREYLSNKEATAEVLKDGRLYTGDIGYMDDEGYFFIVDRKKEMIISGGYNIYPRNIEEVIYTHEAVEECAVIGINHEIRGQVPKAFIVLKEGQEMRRSEMKDFLKDKMAVYSVPHEVEFIEELPKSMIGKILKKELS